MRRRVNSIFFITLGFFLLFHGGHFYAVDNFTVFQTGRALLERGELHVPASLGTVQGPDGRSYGMYSIGLPILQAPLALLGSLIDDWSPRAFEHIAGKSVSLYYPESFAVFAATLVTPVFAALAAGAFWGVAELLGYRRRVVAILTLVLVTGTQLWPASRDSFPHVVIAFCVLGAIGHLLTWRDPSFRRAPLAAGAVLGLMVLVRPFDAACALPPLLLFAVAQDWRSLRGETPLRDIILLCFPVFVAVAIVGFHNAARFGDPLTLVPSGQTTIAFNHPVLSGMYGLLIGAQRGIVFYSPPVIAGVVGLVLLAGRRPREAALLAALIVAFVVPYAHYALWNAGVSWGTRFLVPIVPLALLGAGELLTRGRGPALAFAALALAGVAVQLAGSLVDFHRVTAGLLHDPSNATSMDTLMPIWLHWKHLLRLSNLDPLAWRIYQEHGFDHLLAYLALPAVLIMYGLYALGTELEKESDRPSTRHAERVQPVLTTEP